MDRSLACFSLTRSLASDLFPYAIPLAKKSRTAHRSGMNLFIKDRFRDVMETSQPSCVKGEKP